MKPKEEKYERFLDILKRNPPLLENPEELTGDILRQIALLPSRNKTGKVWNICGWLSATAAVILLCFLLGEIKRVESNHSWPARTEMCLQYRQTWAEINMPSQACQPDMDIMDKSRFASQAWSKYRKKENGKSIKLSVREINTFNK